MIFPVFHGVGMSLMTENPFTGESTFTGFAQYGKLFADPDFLNALVQSMILVVGVVVFGMILAMTFALVLHNAPWGGRIWRTIVLVPWLISGVAVATIGRAIFSSSGGFAHTVLLFFGIEPITWFADGATAMIVIIMLEVWAISPFATLILYAGLQTVNPELYEAAALDGANAVQRFRHVTIASISPQFSLSMIFLSFGAFNSFDIILVTTGGGPGRSTEVLALLLYRMGFDRLDPNGAAAVMVVLLVINLLLSILYVKITPSRD